MKPDVSIFNRSSVKFLIAMGGIYISYIYYGLVMERLFNVDYSGLNRPKGTYEKFSYGFATSLFQNFFSFLFAASVNRYYYKQRASRMDLKSQVVIGSCSFSSIFLASQALNYVSFPIQAIMKSCKIISILTVSFLLGCKGQHTKSQYFCGLIITAGIILFNMTEDRHKTDDTSSSIIGILAILVSLFCDGLLGTAQGEVKKKYQPSQWDQMESMNKWAGLICLSVAIMTFQFGSFVAFVLSHPLIIKDLVLLAIFGTSGHVFVFYTIANFSPLILNIITTTRKFFTVVVSILIYNHPINTYQWMSIALVFLGVFVEMFAGSKKQTKEEVPKLLPEEDLEAAKIVAKSENVNRRTLSL